MTVACSAAVVFTLGAGSIEVSESSWLFAAFAAAGCGEGLVIDGFPTSSVGVVVSLSHARADSTICVQRARVAHSDSPMHTPPKISLFISVTAGWLHIVIMRFSVGDASMAAATALLLSLQVPAKLALSSCTD